MLITIGAKFKSAICAMVYNRGIHVYKWQCRKKLEAIFRVQLEKKKNQSGAEKSNDLMDGLMQIEDDEGKKLSDQEVLDNIVSLVIAGYQSTSLSSMWALYFLAKFPNVLEKLRV